MPIYTTLAGRRGGGSGGGSGAALPAVGTAGNVLTSNGTAWVSQATPAHGMRYRGIVADPASLPTTGNENGDLYYIGGGTTDKEGHAYIWDASVSRFDDVGPALSLPPAGTGGNVLTAVTTGATATTTWQSQPEHWVDDDGDDVTAASGAQWTYTGGGTATPTNIFKAGTGRTGSVTEWQNPAGTVVGSVDARGVGKFGSAEFFGGNGVYSVNAGGGLPATATGVSNTASGVGALRRITTGGTNVATGYVAGTYLTTGARGTYVGHAAGGYVKTGNNNVAIGISTLNQQATNAGSFDGPWIVGKEYAVSGGNLTVDGVAHSGSQDYPFWFTATKTDHNATADSGSLAVSSPSDVSSAVAIGGNASVGGDGDVSIGYDSRARAGGIALGVRAVADPDTIQLGDNTRTFTKIGVGDTRLVPLSELKTLVAGANSWHEFQTAIASLT